MAEEEIVLNLRVPDGFFEELDRRFAEAADKFTGRLRAGGTGGGGVGFGGGGGAGGGAGGTASDASGTGLGAAIVKGVLGAGLSAAAGIGVGVAHAALSAGTNRSFAPGLLDSTTREGNLISLSGERADRTAAQGKIDFDQNVANIFGAIGWGSFGGFQGEADRLRAQNDRTFGVKDTNANKVAGIYDHLARLGVPYSDADVKATAKFSLAIEKRAYDARMDAYRLAQSIDVPLSVQRGSGASGN
jgi:hypothetical protein